MLILTAATYLIAYVYSIERNAVLQYSVLLFVFPFAVILLFSFIKDLKPGIKYSILMIYTSVSIYTLVSEREHYRVQYKSVFRETLAESAKAIQAYGAENVIVVNNFREEINEFYTSELDLDVPEILRFDTLTSFIAFRDDLLTLNKDYLALGFVNIEDLEFLAIARDLYPHVLKKETYYTGDYYLLSRLPDELSERIAGNDVIFELERKNREMFDYMTGRGYAMLWENELLRMPGWLGYTLFQKGDRVCFC
jgi:hypothetical protein